MEKKRIALYAGLLFLGSWLLVNLFITFAGFTEASTKESRINAINAEISRLEIIMLKSLPECEKASEAKENKAKLEGEKVELVHGPFSGREEDGFQNDLN